MIKIEITIEDRKGELIIKDTTISEGSTRREDLVAAAYKKFMQPMVDTLVDGDGLPRIIPEPHPRYVKEYDAEGNPRYKDPLTRKLNEFDWSTCKHCGYRGVEMINDEPNGFAYYRSITTWCPSCGRKRITS
jgi:hypothetical protein